MTTLNLTSSTYFDNPFDATSFQITLTPAYEYLRYIGNNPWQYPGFIGSPADHANDIFTSFQDAIDYHVATNGQDILDHYNSIFSSDYTAIGTVYYNLSESEIDYISSLGAVSSSRTINGHPLSANIDLDATDLGLAAVASTGSFNDLSDKPSIPSGARVTSVLTGFSLVGAGATGTRISASKDSTVKVNVSLSATASISGAASSNITLKKCATNSVTETDWIIALPTIGEIGQSYSLALALQGTQTDKRQLSIDIPAGWYVKAENSGTGTHSESITGVEKTLYN